MAASIGTLVGRRVLCGFFTRQASSTLLREHKPAIRCSHYQFQRKLVQPSVLGQRFGRLCRFSTEASAEPDAEEEQYHNIIKDTERGKGASTKKEFQADTKKLLEIVARSLYSEKEVFIRELISNASDALEKLRYLATTGADVADRDRPLEIHIHTDDEKKTFTIQDTGVGMTEEELVSNLGTIARSGSKTFLEELEDKQEGEKGNNLIGQFGVGFYSAFMVGERITVYSRSYHEDATPFKWISEGTGDYELSEADGVQRGTKIVVQLKGSDYDFAKEEIIKDIIKKYSNFVGVPIFLNGKRTNLIEALWLKEPRDVSDDEHEEFYRFLSNMYDRPRYHLHYKTDAPLNIRALLYVPEYKPTLFDMSRETDVSLSLYSRKVMIMSKANAILPRWLRFVRGVVDSEDIPLNLSRELLQDSALIRKLQGVLTTRLLRFFSDQAKKDPQKYMEFYSDYGLFFREGIVTSPEQSTREEIAKLLRFPSSQLGPDEYTSLDEYASRMKAGARDIYYFAAPSRELAETSPYMEAMRARDQEVLFLHEPYDELVLMNLAQYDRKNLKSLETVVHSEDTTGGPDQAADVPKGPTLGSEETDELIGWLKINLGNKVQEVKSSRRLETHPCLITVLEMGAARHFLKTSFADKSQDEKYRLLQPTLEINPSHSLMRKLFQLKNDKPELAQLLADQLYDNAMVAAGLIEDARTVVSRLNSLLDMALDKP